MVTDTELNDFLRRIDRLVEPALLFAPKVDDDRVQTAIEKAFDGRPLFTLRANGPIPPDEHDVTETIRNSFEGRGVLAVLVNDKIPPPVVRAVSRLCNDGVFAEKKDGAWTNHKPPDDWRLIMVAQVAAPEDLPGSLADCFPAVMAL